MRWGASSEALIVKLECEPCSSMLLANEPRLVSHAVFLPQQWCYTVAVCLQTGSLRL